MSKPVLVLDFDGVIHHNTKWQGADVVEGEPVEGALDFINEALIEFDVHVYSSRSHMRDGLKTMQDWLREQFESQGYDCYSEIRWPRWKPRVHVMIDDRAVCFDGEWPDLDELRRFKPWNK